MVDGLPEGVLMIPVPSMGLWPRGNGRRRTPLRRCSDFPDDLTKAVVFLACDVAGYIAGAVLVDGGHSLR